MQISHKSIAIILLAGTVILAACGTYQAYPGPALPDHEIAVIIGDYRIRANSPFGVFLRKIDGQVIPQNNSRVAVKPGSHALLVDCYLDRPDNLTRHEIEANVQAGQRYRLEPVFAAGNRECDSVKLVADRR
jgi:hypothetical protein